MSHRYEKSEFKQEFTFQDRSKESSRMLTKYPDKRPIICEKLNKQMNFPKMDKKKYLVPYDFILGQFIQVIRNRLKLQPEEAIFVFINNQLLSINYIMGEVYDRFKDADGFLYMQYAKENTFGI